MKSSIKVSSKLLLKANFIVILILVIAHLIFGSETYSTTVDPRDWARFFSLDWEENLPTLFSTLSLLIASLLSIAIALISELKRQSRWIWFSIGLIFLGLCIDEWEMIHERLEFSGTGSWAYLYLIGVAAFILLYSSFVLGLPKRIRDLMIVSFSLFILGSVGMELIALQVLQLEPDPKIPMYFFFSTLEETLEMSGIAIFNYTLLKYFLHYRTVIIDLPVNERIGIGN
ncbi:MAG: hypothetical protein AB8B36_05980 [Prochlorococcus sp.]